MSTSENDQNVDVVYLKDVEIDIKEQTSTPATIEFKNLKLQTKKLLILDNLSGYCCPGQFLALMGPSGAGKSSLLNLLCQRKLMLFNSQHSGEILINGVPFSKKDKSRIGYVMQQDIFIENLTLAETMRFYEKLRLPDSWSKTQKRKRVMDVLRSLEIDKYLDTLIGGGIIRGLSGGEKKRANIAVELICDPSIVFLDEPTSGLDSGISLLLVESLRNLASKESKTIIASIHQPNSQIFFMFTHLYLLSMGQCHYFGPIGNLVEYYEKIALPCTENWNIADYMIERTKDTDDIRKFIVEECQKMCNFEMPEEFKSYYISASNKPKKLHQNKLITEYSALSRRCFVKTISETFTLLNICEAIFIGSVAGIIYFQTPFVDTHYFTVTTMCFYPVIVSMIQPLFVHVTSFTEEASVIIRERSSGIYRLGSYFLAKTVSELPSIFLRPTLYFSAFYFLCGFSYSAWFLVSWILMIFLAFLGQSLGMLFSSYGLAFRETMLVVTLYFSFVLLTGGIFNRALPYWLEWGPYISPFYHGYVVFLSMQVYAQGGIKCTNNYVSMIAACTNSSGVATLNDVLLTEKIVIPVWGSILALILMMIACRIAAFFFLGISLKRPPLSSTINFNFFIKKDKNRAKLAE